MITIEAHRNSDQAIEYFDEHLSTDDYYSEGRENEGKWHGALVAKFGLNASVRRDEFVALAENKFPYSEQKLTPRTKKNRRVLYDAVFSPPKSVSVIALVAEESGVLDAHRKAVRSALKDLEAFCETRVRTNGANASRRTGNALIASFEHTTSRLNDPQLHTHCAVFNVTYDPVEKRYKALEARSIYDHATYITAVYRNELAKELKRLGFELTQGTHSFEIKGVSPAVLKRFSKRSVSIKAEEKRLVEKLGRSLTNNELSVLAHNTRIAKSKDLNPEELLAYQRGQLSKEEFETLLTVREEAKDRMACAPLEPERSPEIRTKEVLELGISHLFERKSTASIHDLKKAVLNLAAGSIDLPTLEREIKLHPELISDGETITHKEHLKLETSILDRIQTLSSSISFEKVDNAPCTSLTFHQNRVLESFLSSRSSISILEGYAGTGKSSVLFEVASRLREAGIPVDAIAPTHRAADNLHLPDEIRPRTVRSFLGSRSHRKGVLIVDEASLLSIRETNALLQKVSESGSRLLLVGDPKQHHAVEAGDAFRLIYERSNVERFQLDQILRQQNPHYKKAVQDLVHGRTDETIEGLKASAVPGELTRALGYLERTGSIVEIPHHELREVAIAREYVAMKEAGAKTLAVTTTWKEVRAISQDVRAILKDKKVIDESLEVEAKTYPRINLTSAELQTPRTFENRGSQLYVKYRYDGLDRMDQIQSVDETGVRVERQAKEAVLTFKDLSRLNATVHREETLLLAPGDAVQVRMKDEQGKMRQVLGEVDSVDEKRLSLKTGESVSLRGLEATYGYALTSQSAQGLSVDHVICAMRSDNSYALSLNQFYVGISRGRQSVSVYVDDLDTVKSSFKRNGSRKFALEVLESKLRAEGRASERTTSRTKDREYAREEEMKRERFDDEFGR